MSTRRFPVRLIQLLSLVLCYSLLFSTLLIMKPQASLAGNSQGQAGPPVGGQKVDPPRPIAGPPGVGLPNTDAVLRRPRLTTPIVQPAIPSVQRRYRHPRLSNSASLGGRGDIGDAEGAAAESVQPVWRQSNSTGNSRRKVAQEGVRLSHSRPRRARSAGEDAHAPSAPVMLPQGGLISPPRCSHPPIGPAGRARICSREIFVGRWASWVFRDVPGWISVWGFRTTRWRLGFAPATSSTLITITDFRRRGFASPFRSSMATSTTIPKPALTTICCLHLRGSALSCGAPLLQTCTRRSILHICN